MARRSTNSHAARMKALPHVARPHRIEPFRVADEAELKAAADRIAGPPAQRVHELHGFDIVSRTAKRPYQPGARREPWSTRS